MLSVAHFIYMAKKIVTQNLFFAYYII